jgi:hypothetical protein
LSVDTKLGYFKIDFKTVAEELEGIPARDKLDLVFKDLTCPKFDPSM